MAIWTLVNNAGNICEASGLYCTDCKENTEPDDMTCEEGLSYKEMVVAYRGWAEERCDCCNVILVHAINVPKERAHKGASLVFPENLS